MEEAAIDPEWPGGAGDPAPPLGADQSEWPAGAIDPELPASAYMVLAMVRDGFKTGYLIKQRVERVASFFWSASYGQIYPELRRLEVLGLLASHEAHVSGRTRREYELTPTGAESLQRWLEQPAQPTLWLRDEAMLRMMLVDWDDRELTLQNLLRLRRLALARLEVVRARTPQRARGQMIQDYGVHLLEATLSWCDRAEAWLREPPERDRSGQ
jgi:DNA-binding PadR family transcriptional regulator